MVNYIKRRSTDKVNFSVEAPGEPVITKISAPLFDWVIENLLKNALDAMEGKGNYQYKNKEQPGHIIVDVQIMEEGSASKISAKFLNPASLQKKGLGTWLIAFKKNY